MKKRYFVLAGIFAVLVAGALILSCDKQIPTGAAAAEEPITLKGFSGCLAEKGMVIYGARTCPYCVQVVTLLGGYENAAPVYVECTEHQERCAKEMTGRGVPEIQVNGVKYQGQRSLEAFAQATGCTVPESSA